MKFEKVSFKEFKRYTTSNMHCGADEYENIIMPQRATPGSAGYDIASPVNITIPGGCKRMIPTGLKVKLEEGWMLKLHERSGVAYDKDIEFRPAVGVIDSDYYDSEKTEGQIFVGIKNESTRPLFIAAGERIAQGIFEIHGLTEDDQPRSEKRTGGFGSTGRK